MKSKQKIKRKLKRDNKQINETYNYLIKDCPILPLPNNKGSKVFNKTIFDPNEILQFLKIRH
jgi:hypothetical protein